MVGRRCRRAVVKGWFATIPNHITGRRIPSFWTASAARGGIDPNWNRELQPQQLGADGCLVSAFREVRGCPLSFLRAGRSVACAEAATREGDGSDGYE